MDCKQALELLSRQLDGELDEAGSAALTQHLQTCADCRSRQAQYRQMDADIASLRVAAPDGLTEKILEKARQEGEKPPRRRHMWGVGTAAAVLAAAFVFYATMAFFPKAGQALPPAAAEQDYDTAPAEEAAPEEAESAQLLPETESMDQDAAGQTSETAEAEDGGRLDIEPSAAPGNGKPAASDSQNTSPTDGFEPGAPAEPEPDRTPPAESEQPEEAPEEMPQEPGTDGVEEPETKPEAPEQFDPYAWISAQDQTVLLLYQATQLLTQLEGGQTLADGVYSYPVSGQTLRQLNGQYGGELFGSADVDQAIVLVVIQ